MIEVKKEGIVLQRLNLEFENESVLNPAVMQEGNTLYVFYRAVRLKNYSTIGFCKLDGPLTVTERYDRPFLAPEFDYESHGMEDPRIVKIDGVYYLSYVAFDGKSALGAVATSEDLDHFSRCGIISPAIKYQDFDRFTKKDSELNKKYLYYNEGADILADKDVVFFPRRINAKLVFLHRIKPDIQLVAVNDLSELTDAFWNDYFSDFGQYIVLGPKYPHEVCYVGSGCPPIETEHGWLFIYHGVKLAAKRYEYSCCAALLDLDDPRKELARLPYPLFKPELEYELRGDVDDVVFPTGTALFGDKLYIYYGAADELIACASVSFKGLIDELLQNKA